MVVPVGTTHGCNVGWACDPALLVLTPPLNPNMLQRQVFKIHVPCFAALVVATTCIHFDAMMREEHSLNLIIHGAVRHSERC